MSFVQKLVSKKKRRYEAHGFNLDMSYITDQIIAMGYPSEKIEAMYRNPYKEVFAFFEKFHHDKYKVYNLCSERFYDPIKFHNRVECFPFDDHNAPPFELIYQFCTSVREWVAADDENIALIHCVPAEHEILTERGFLDLAAYEALAARGAAPRVAGYDAATRQLVFERPHRLVRNRRRAQTLVEFSSPAARRADGQWSAARPAASSPPPPALSVQVTTGHDMFVECGDGQHRKVAAEQLLRSGARARHVAAAAGGVRADAKAAAAAARVYCDALRLQSAAQEQAFLELYGAWLRHGGNDVARDGAVVVNAAPATLVELASAAECAGLQRGRDWQAESGSAHLRIRHARWLAFFADAAAGSEPSDDAMHVDGAPNGAASWVWQLDVARVRSIVRGLRLAAAPTARSIAVPSARVRDDVLRLLLLAGHAAYFARDDAGDAWLVHFGEWHRDAALCAPETAPARGDVRKRAYDGRTWCFEMPSGFIVTRRAEKAADGALLAASQPLITGNCKAGKGRTGVMICNWLMFSGEWNSPEDSMAYYAAMRTYNMKGVTIPSQIRYIHYFAKSLVRNELPVRRYRRARLQRITLHTVPMTDGQKPIYFEILERNPESDKQPIERRVVYRYAGDAAAPATVRALQKAQKQRMKDDADAYLARDAYKRADGVERLTFELTPDGFIDTSVDNASAQPSNSFANSSHDPTDPNDPNESNLAAAIAVTTSGNNDAAQYCAPAARDDGFEFTGDVLVQFFEGKPGKAEKLFFFWINSHHVDKCTVMEKRQVDKAHKDKKSQTYTPNFHVQLDFSHLQPLEEVAAAAAVDDDGAADDKGRRRKPAADMLADRRGHVRISRSGTLEAGETILNDGEPEPAEQFAEAHRSDGLVDSSPCALAAYLCELAAEALEKNAERCVVGGAALAGAAVSSLPSSIGRGGGDDAAAPAVSAESLAASSKEAEAASATSSSRLRVVGYSGLKALGESSMAAQLEAAARQLQHVSTLNKLRHAERVSFWLNVYNALSVHANAVYLPTTLRERLHTQLHYKYRIGDDKFSLAEIQIFMLRNTLPVSVQLERLLRERIEWRNRKSVLPGALLTSEPIVTMCISDGVPSAAEIVPYWPDQIDEQLRRAARRYFARLFRVDRREKRALLPRVLSWVRRDFGRDRAERLAMLGDLMEPDQRRALFECGKRANGIHYTCNDQTLGFACPSTGGSSRSGRSGSSSDGIRRQSSGGSGGGGGHRRKTAGHGLSGSRSPSSSSLSRSRDKPREKRHGDGNRRRSSESGGGGDDDDSSNSRGGGGGRRRRKNRSLRRESESGKSGGAADDDAASSDTPAASDEKTKKSRNKTRG